MLKGFWSLVGSHFKIRRSGIPWLISGSHFGIIGWSGTLGLDGNTVPFADLPHLQSQARCSMHRPYYTRPGQWSLKPGLISDHLNQAWSVITWTRPDQWSLKPGLISDHSWSLIHHWVAPGLIRAAWSELPFYWPNCFTDRHTDRHTDRIDLHRPNYTRPDQGCLLPLVHAG
jgi:hypothetical protein